jgi:hypothetical protein
VLVLCMSAGRRRWGYAGKRRGVATNAAKRSVFVLTTEARLPSLHAATAALGYDGSEQIDHENNQQHDAVQDNGSAGAQRNCGYEQRQGQ